MNLVINAMQAVERKGRIEVAAASGDDSVAVAVRDNGPGIPPEKLVSIFDPYFTTKPEGSGLGLWIAQQIVTAHGGSLEGAERAGGQGAVFTMTLAPASADRQHQSWPVDKPKSRSWSWTTSRGCAPACRRPCGARATWSMPRPMPPAASKLAEERLYNLVISDIKMPGLSGLDLLAGFGRAAVTRSSSS